jgi:D-glycero-D-manno-heptose 1,7-bisphosphate phosphatase
MNSELECNPPDFHNSPILNSLFPSALPFGSRLNGGKNRPAIFLDRDGVLIESLILAGTPHPPPSVASMRIEPGVLESLARLGSAGFLLLVVTNQPDVARGKQTRVGVEAIHDRLRRELPLDGIHTCYHDTPDNCACRKPKPGLLLDAAAAHGVDLHRSYMIGDRWSDIAAGEAVGCRTILLERSYSGRERCSPTHVVADLVEAADAILTSTEQRT